MIARHVFRWPHICGHLLGELHAFVADGAVCEGRRIKVGAREPKRVGDSTMGVNSIDAAKALPKKDTISDGL